LTGFLIPVRLLGSKFLLDASRSPNIENLLRIGPMLMFEWILSLLFAAVVLTNLAERLAVPYPSLLALAGAGLAFLPFAPQIRIEPELALALFVAPALLDAAFDTSPRDLRSNAIPIASMAVVAVVLTAIAVAYLGWRFAGMPIAAAIALGAIASPPDPVAANEVLRHLRVPQRIGLVLQGEGLLNDATALLIYGAAVTAAAGSFSLVGNAPILFLTAAASAVAGYLLARLYLIASTFARDPASSTVLQFVGTFGVWLLSERLTLSPIITIVVYAMTLAQAAPGRLGPRLRVSSYSVWETAVFAVNVLAFVLMGLQARTIIERLSPEQRWGSLGFGLSVLAVIIVVRIAWLAAYRAIVAIIRRWRPNLADRMASRDPRGAIVMGWSGMRGLITLATAFALPQQFPRRDLIVLCAFCVVLGTLVIQGFTLRPLLRLLRFQDDGAVERDLSRARVIVMQAALDSLDGEMSPTAATVREQYSAARKVAEDQHEPQAATMYDVLRLRAIAAQRAALYRLRAGGEIGDEAFRRIQEELDWSELDAAPAGSFQSLAS
jgi:Na+/H+ antiporter